MLVIICWIAVILLAAGSAAKPELPVLHSVLQSGSPETPAVVIAVRMLDAIDTQSTIDVLALG